MTRINWQITLAGVCLLIIVLLQTSIHPPGELGIGGYERLERFVSEWGLAGVIYAISIWLVVRGGNRTSVAIILIMAAALRISPLMSPPFLSTDVFRYVWDGRVQTAGINPYNFIPSDQELVQLRDTQIYPFINRSDYAPTIYPPAAQMIFLAVASLSQTVIAMKFAMVLAELIAVIAMLEILQLAGLPRARVIIYAWNPIVVWEYSGNGHLDVIAIAFTGLALLTAARWRPAMAGFFLAAAALTKFLPVIIAPGLWARMSGGGPRSVLAPLTFLGTCIVAYGCYASAGPHIFGFLTGYSREEGLRNGNGVYALQLLSNFIALPSWAAAAWFGSIVAVVVMISWAAVLTREHTVIVMAQFALLLSTVAIVAVSPHYAWYFGGLAYLSCLVAWRSVIWLSIACGALYLDTAHVTTGWANFVYGPFAALAIIDGLRARHLFKSKRSLDVCS